MVADISLITDIKRQNECFYPYKIKGKAEDIDVLFKFLFLLSNPGFGTKLEIIYLVIMGI